LEALPLARKKAEVGVEKAKHAGMEAESCAPQGASVEEALRRLKRRGESQGFLDLMQALLEAWLLTP
jgi:hypothetical protein